MNDRMPKSTFTDPESERPALLTTPEAARYLGLAVSTLNKWRVYGYGPAFVKLGRAVRYRQDDLDRFLETRARRSTSES